MTCLRTLIILAFLFNGNASAKGIEKNKLEATFKNAAANYDFHNIGLVLYDQNNKAIFKSTIGKMDPKKPIAIASSSKWITTVILMRLVEKNVLSLDTKLGDIFKEIVILDPRAREIKLRHLLSFQSGYVGDHPCTVDYKETLDHCVETILKLKLLENPETAFRYGNVNQEIAARMAEIVTKKSWNQILKSELVDFFKMHPDTTYYTHPRDKLGGKKPLPSAGLLISPVDYAKVLTMFLNDGVYKKEVFISKKYLGEMFKSQFSKDMKGIYSSPFQYVNPDVPYGFGAWIESENIISSPGAFGFVPWIDRKNKYSGILFQVNMVTKSLKRNYMIIYKIRDQIEKGLLPK
ncbi:MAG: serine hydrolase [Bacteriovorax sp.]|jgi:CubicO group peptidase (beta-lactamase class C family)